MKLGLCRTLSYTLANLENVHFIDYKFVPYEKIVLHHVNCLEKTKQIIACFKWSEFMDLNANLKERVERKGKEPSVPRFSRSSQIPARNVQDVLCSLAFQLANTSRKKTDTHTYTHRVGPPLPYKGSRASPPALTANFRARYLSSLPIWISP